MVVRFGSAHKNEQTYIGHKSEQRSPKQTPGGDKNGRAGDPLRLNVAVPYAEARAGRSLIVSALAVSTCEIPWM